LVSQFGDFGSFFDKSGEIDFKKFAFFSLFDDIFAFFERSCCDLTVF